MSKKWVYLFIFALSILLIWFASITWNVGSINETKETEIQRKEQELKDQKKKVEEQDKKIKQLNKKLESKRLKSALAQRDRQQLAAKTPPQTSQPHQNQLSNPNRAYIANYILSKFGANGNTALAIAYAESGLNPNATNYNDARYTGCYSYGVFQINRCDSNLYDWKYNVDEAHKMFLARGWWPWTVYKTGVYIQYL